MSGAAVLAGLLTAAVAALLVRPVGQPSSGIDDPVVRPARSSGIRRLRVPLAGVAAAGGWALVGGPAGLLAAVVAAVGVWVVLGRSEDPAAVRRRERLAADLPVAVGLLGTCLESGAAPEPALVAVAQALGGPCAEELLAVHHRLAVGVPPDQVWRQVGAHPQLGPLGRAVGRATQTGASIGPAVQRLADELRDRTDAEVQARARSIEVKAAAPLGLCLLPAFLLLGVVPMVVGLFSSMQLF